MSDEHYGNEPDDTEFDDVEASTDRHNDEHALDLIERLQAENAELKDRYLRLAADMENLRRRTARDVKDAKSYSIAGFARDMLQVSDNLRRTLDSVPEQAADAEDTGLKALVEGVDLTERAMLSALERHGVRKVDPKGQKFDPNFHQAMFEIPNPDLPNNTVVEVVQSGYVLGERMLRPAMVGVAKGGPKEVAAEPGAPIAESEKDA
ncbi:molecular chaperone GrpE [Hoeflea marina]|uniref:Protein GrpE n=1 Tax=Hoeflea marina TaxID=274592 RepID=A0A317PID5_9HYPH|nr:nucleotide exchange factor GrpE [Hoeflea marina]PWW00094.1 molecular chaperone GrpE [Hoeflea marina]